MRSFVGGSISGHWNGIGWYCVLHSAQISQVGAGTVFNQIRRIRDFGVFNDFSGGNLPAFAKFNLLFGWNYSGKTTLSRLFRCLENRALHADYPGAKFSLSHSDGNDYEQDFATYCNVRVFNEDFRKENLRWDEADGFTPILLLGAENIEKRSELAIKEAEHQKLSNQLTKAEEEASRLRAIISSTETECAGQIAKELGLARFDRRHLRPIIDKWEGVLPDPLDDDGFQSEKRKAIATEEKSILPEFNFQVAAVDEEWSAAACLLEEQPGSSGTIDRLVESPLIGSWVKQGLHLHTAATHCEFCEGPLKPERIEALNAHFSDAFDRLQNRINGMLQPLRKRLVNLDGAAYTRSAFYSDLETEHTEAGTALRDARDALNKDIQALIDLLESKRENPFRVLKAPEKQHDIGVLKAAVHRFRQLIERNNERTRDFAQTRNASIDKLKIHYAVEAMRKIDRFGLETQITNCEETARIAKDARALLDLNIAALQGELSNAAKGADAINEALLRFFGKADIQVKVTSEGNYRLMRGDRTARNLSEGERTAIAFCYFVTKLFESGNNLADTIVYIDDPISSLDAHHLLHINAFIKGTFYKFDNQANPKHQCLVKQLFISTHNYEYFHLTWEWMSERTPKGLSAAYLVERTDNNGLICSRIIECPVSIKQYRSEYLFLFHQLVAYAENPTNDPQIIFNLGNMARRFVEGYLAFKFLEHDKIDISIPKLIPKPLEAERARKFMHFYSHTLKRAGGMQLPDLSEAQAVVNIILDAVRAHDPIHYGALQATR